jgi:hypothetical protein
MSWEGARAVPDRVRRGPGHTGMNQQAELVDEGGPEEGADQRSTAVHPHDPGVLRRQQCAESRGQIHSLDARHDLAHRLASCVRRSCGGTEREHVAPVAAVAKRLPLPNASPPVHHGEQRAVRGGPWPRGVGQGPLLGEDGVRAGEGHILSPRAGERVEPPDVRLEAGGGAVERHRHVDDDLGATHRHASRPERTCSP